MSPRAGALTRIDLAVLALVVLALTLTACGDFGSEEEDRPASRVDADGGITLTRAAVAALGLRTVPSRRGRAGPSRVRFGKVLARPADDVRIVAPVQARLIDVAAALGRQVEADDVLATLEPSVDAVARADLTTRLARADAQLAAGWARVRAAEIERSRLEKLVASGLATPSQRARAEADLEAERATIASLQGTTRILRDYTGDHVEITTPTAGTVVQLETEVGALLRQGQVVARVLRPGPRWIDLAVPAGDPAGDAYGVVVGGARLAARLLARGELVAGGLRTDRLGIDAADGATLSPGRMVAVEVRQEIAGVVVPLGAVVRRGDERLVFVEAHPGLYQPRPIRVAGIDAENAVLASGLEVGERVVVQGAAQLLAEIGFSGLSRRAGGAAEDEASQR